MTKNMTEGSPMKLILGFSIPMLFGMLFQQFYNLVDTMIVGKTLYAMLIFPLIEAFLNLSLWNNLLAFSAKFDTASTAFPEISAENFSIPDPISAISSLFSDLH